MKWGMVKLTHAGMIDSLSVEERAAEDLKNEQFRIQLNLDRMGERLERDHITRLMNDPEYDPEEIVTSESESEAESEESESSYAEDPEEDEF
jgi:allophanate hydrolase subunit 2